MEDYEHWIDKLVEGDDGLVDFDQEEEDTVDLYRTAVFDEERSEAEIEDHFNRIDRNSGVVELRGKWNTHKNSRMKNRKE